MSFRVVSLRWGVAGGRAARLAIRRSRNPIWIDWPVPPQAAAIAQFDRAGQQLELADLELRRKAASSMEDPSVEHFRPIVEATLREVMHVAEVNTTSRAASPIRFGSAAVFVRLIGGKTPKVQVFSPLLWELSSTSGLLEILNDINTRLAFGRVFRDGEQVIAAIDLPASGLSGE